MVTNLTEFTGAVVPVNPNRTTVFGEQCYPSLSDIPDAERVDLAIIVVPAPAVNEIVRECGDIGIQNIVVITAGFGERGPEGREREEELKAIAGQHGLNIVGPNCVGIINTQVGLNATFLQHRPDRGKISLLSQSGAFISAVIGWATQHNIGFNQIVSLGNEAVLDEVDFIEEWGQDPETHVILAYVEDIANGREFIQRAKDVTPDTPLVVIKPGRTSAGAQAAASHTGSIAGSDEAYQAGLYQGGALRAMNIQDVFDMGRVLADQPPLSGNAVGVVTNGGGPGVVATDAVGDSQLSIADFSDHVQRTLTANLPDGVEVKNPLDLIGDAGLDRYRTAIDTLLQADTIGGLVVIAVPTTLFEFEDLATELGELHEQYEKPIVACLMGGEEADVATDVLDTYGIPNYFDPTRAVNGLEALARYAEVRARDHEPPTEFDVDQERARTVLDTSLASGSGRLSVEAMELLDAYGISIPDGGLATSQAEAVDIAQDLGGPVVLKIASPDLLHKSDIGGVAVDVPPEAVGQRYQQIVDRAGSHDPEAEILGVQVEEYVEIPESTETIVGVKRDPQFGHLVMFGLGGIFVEIFEDTAFRIAPVSQRDAREMTEEIQAAPMLRGARGRTPADIDRVVETIQRVSQLVVDFPAIEELDVNPLIVGPDSVCAVDLRLTVADGEFGDP